MSSSIVETVDIEAPVAVTWALWSDVTQWPKFLSHVQRVDPLDEK
ncbi:cyclase, partial [Streptomyces sp. SID8455]|nr:cyclase [Streptomyces sp. SID8455]